MIPVPEPDLTPEDMVRRANAMVPTLRERQAECERLGRIPQATNDEFVAAGFYRILQPRRGVLWPRTFLSTDGVSMNIGDLVAEPLYDGLMRAPATLFYGGTTTEQWAPHQRFLEPDGMLRFDLGGFLARGGGLGDRVVLIDAGMGPRSGLMRDGQGTYQGGELLNSLAAHNVRPEYITDVLFTHLHWDHIGWSVNDGAIVFPNATFRCDISRPGAFSRQRAGARHARQHREPHADVGRQWSDLPGDRLDERARSHAGQHDPGHVIGDGARAVAGRRGPLSGGTARR